MNKLGIGIPAYNAETTLLTTLRTIKDQTFQDYSIYILDDGSKDDTIQAAYEGGRLFNKEQPVFIDGHDKNMGIQRTRNDLFNFFYGQQPNGFVYPKCEYFIYIDADLELDNELFERMLYTLSERPDKTYAYCGYQWVGAINGIWRPIHFDANRLRYQNYISTMSMIRMADITPNLLPLIDEELERLEDWGLWLKLLNVGKTGVFLPEYVGFIAHSKQGDNSTRGHQDYFRWQRVVDKKYNQVESIPR